MISKNKLLHTTATLALVASLSACGMTAEKRYQEFNTAFKAGDFCKASDTVMDESDTCKYDIKNEDVKEIIEDADLDSKLNSSAALFLADKSDVSNNMLDQSREKIQEELNSTGILRAIIEILANGSAMDYDPMIMDSVYMNNYTILNALNLKDKKEVKRQIQIGRTNQSDAVNAFAKEIFKAEDLMKLEEEEKNTSKKEDKNSAKLPDAVQQTYDNIKGEFNNYTKEITKQSKELLKTVEKETANQAKGIKFNAYANYANPYLNYLSGIFELTNAKDAQEREDAVLDLRKTNEMVQNNRYIQEDFALAEKLAKGEISKVNPSVWVIFENGQVSKYQELRADFAVTTSPAITFMPLNISRNGVDDEDAISTATKATVVGVGAAANAVAINSQTDGKMSSFFKNSTKGKVVSLSFAIPYTRKEAFKNITISIGSKAASTQTLANMDEIFYAEYKKKLPGMVTKAVTKLAVNLIAQNIAEKKAGALGGLAVGAYGMATASADLRSWYALPKNIQIAKLEKNGASEASLLIGGKVHKVKVSKNGNTLLYVRVPSAKSTPIIKALDL